jgi:hypothetical protein
MIAVNWDPLAPLEATGRLNYARRELIWGAFDAAPSGVGG